MSDPVSPTPPTERITIHLLFLGRRKGTKKKQVWLWYDIDLSLNDGSRLKYDSRKEAYYSGKNIVPHALPGLIVSVQATPDHKTVYPGTAKSVGRWENRDDITLWQSQSRAEEGEIETEQRVLKELKETLPAEALSPFRRAYHKMRNSRHQAHLLAWIIQEITRWRPDDDKRSWSDDD